MEKISEHISYKEAVYSATAKRKGIDNKPTKKQVENMKLIAEKVFEPLREWVGGAIKINSFFRNKATNQAVGGSSSSMHCQGLAIDLDDIYGYKTNAEMFYYICENLEFDVAIWEFGDDENPNWVHVSYRPGANRSKILKAVKERGKTKYLYFKI